MKWKPIKGYEGRYSISDTGVVWSEGRWTEWNGTVRWTKEKEKLARFSPKGYVVVCLSTDGKNKAFSVHRLVAQSFIPNPEGLKEVNHINGDKSDNRVENLEWSDRSRNITHSYRVLESSNKDGTNNGRHVVNEDDVREIRMLKSQGISTRELSQRFGVSDGQIRRIFHRIAWSHVS
jgi:hypothetical protein